jgi:site-specific DNA-methyltransferase (adenine-specific)
MVGNSCDPEDVATLLGDRTVDAVFADPPYCSGGRTPSDVAGKTRGMSRGGRFGDIIRSDGMTSAGFEYLIRRAGEQCRERMEAGSSALWCIDWRQYPTMFGLLESLDWRIAGCVVWDKEAMGMGVGFRRQHEFILHASVGSPAMSDKGTPDVIQHRRETGHAGAKPAGMVARLLRAITPPESLVYDPFLGGGGTLRGAEQVGMTCYGMDVDPEAIASSVEGFQPCIAC